MLEDNVKALLEEAREGDVCVAVPGDPMIATTHLGLVLECVRRGVEVRITNGLSIYTAAVSKSGLHIYKFGRSATVPKTENPSMLRQAYYAVLENLSRGLHTLLFLDTREGGLKAGDALSMLLSVEREEGRGAIGEETLVIALARLGFGDEKIIAGRAREVSGHPLPPPPHTLIIPGDMHFTEKEAVKTYSLDAEAVETYSPPNYVKDRVARYLEKTSKVLLEVRKQGVDENFCSYVEAYVEDSRNFLYACDYVNSLLAIGYAEGLLDALRLLGVVSFEW